MPLDIHSIVITALGMVTPVGHSALQSCASLRADVPMMQELDYFTVENDEFEDEPLIGCPVTGITEGHLGLGRWTKLGSSAVQDLVAQAKLTREHLGSTGLYIALPPLARTGVDARIVSLLGSRLAQWTGIASFASRTRTYPQGHAASIAACRDAMADLNAGSVALAIVGGIDSLVEPDTLEFLLKHKRLKTTDHPDGFIPGEAAAFFLLECAGHAATRGALPVASLASLGLAEEPDTVWGDQPSSASGLSEAIQVALGALPDQGVNIGVVIGDLNGENYRAKEYATAVPRTLSQVQAPWRLWHAADCIGDTGAASGAISICMGARALQRGYARTQNILVWGASDDGLRGALCLNAVA